jgi:long-chain-fatty-acid--CoA ligase ACSBG
MHLNNVHPLRTSSKYVKTRIRYECSNVRAQTVPEFFAKAVAKHGSKIAYVDSKGEATTYRDYEAQVRMVAKSFIELGLKKLDCVNIIGFNGPEWVIANMASILAGCVPSGVYATNNAEACGYVANHSKAKVVVCRGNKQLAKYLEIQDELSDVRAIVVYGEEINSSLRKQFISIRCFGWDEFMHHGSSSKNDDTLKERINIADPAELCSLIYTSGTTGNPKAVMLSHDNITWTVDHTIDTLMDTTIENRIVSYLPLSHVAAQLVDMYIPISSGSTVYFATPDALKGGLGATLRMAKPTIFFGVPRVWEKIQEQMLRVGASVGGMKKRLVGWAKAKGKVLTESKAYGIREIAPGCVDSVYDRLVFSKVREKLGLDECYLHLTGAAPIAKSTVDYFMQLKIPIMEIYGMSESVALGTFNYIDNWKPSTVGKKGEGTVFKNDPLTGEICWKGRNIFMGYMGMEDKTMEAIDEEGYLHSGDIGEFDEDGFMRITGRIKDLIITAGGENIAPVLIEDTIKSICSVVSNAVVVGDRKKFLGVLLCLKTEVDAEGEPTNRLSEECLDVSKVIGSTAQTVGEAQDCELWNSYLESMLKEKVNEKVISRAQRVQKFRILDYDLSVGNGLLTPTMKVKRSTVIERWSEVVDTMY